MIAHPFRYHAPATLEEATRLLAGLGDAAAAMAGGTWLLPDMGRAERRPSDVVDLRRLGLGTVHAEGDTLLLGACTTYEQLKVDTLVGQALPLLRTMAGGITGGRGITGQGTVGGAACYGNPAADIPACLVALGARMRLRSAAGERDVPAEAFFTGPFRTARRPDELLVAIVVDRAAGRVAAGYHKLKLSGSSWPIVTAACCVTADGEGLRVRVAIGAASGVPALGCADCRADDPGGLQHAASRAVAALGDGWTDELADADYRLAVAPEVARRAVAAAQAVLHG